MSGYILVNYNGETQASISKKAKGILEQYKPKDCPFDEYSMLDLLKDWISMYSWMAPRNMRIPLTDYIKLIKGRYTVEVYSNSMIELLEEG